MSATDLALRAFEARPTRAEPLVDLARYYRERNQHESASLFARRGLSIPPSDDLLFVETGVHASLAEDLSISGYYSRDPETREAAARVCDNLGLDRSVSQATRDLARKNLHFYLKQIGTQSGVGVPRETLQENPVEYLFETWRSHRLTFSPPPGYNQMAPSVTRLGSKIVAALRTINYKLDERGYVRLADDLPMTAGGKIHTRTFLLDIDPETLADCPRGEILLPADLPPPVYDAVTGFEDMRLFEWCGELWSLSTVLDQNPDARAEQWMARIGPDLRMCEARAINPEPIRARDKNWMPVVEGPRLRFVYWSDPTRIIDHHGQTLAETAPEFAADHFRGSSQAIPFEGGWLAVIHWVQWFDNWPKYRHRFVWYDRELRLRKVSPGWVFSTKQPELDLLGGYEYCTGLCWHPDGGRLIVGYQIHEREAWVGVMDAKEVAATLRMPSSGYHPASRPLAAPAAIADDLWAREQTNHALQDIGAVERATQALTVRRLPEHKDRIKNWDTWLALTHALRFCRPKDRVLDAGGDRNSAFLPGLAKSGFNNLTSINLEEVHPGRENGVNYLYGDIINTELLPASCQFVACLSVLEHGVNWVKFLDEAARILSSGGHLFISVDFWETPVSTAHVVFQGTYRGQRWEIFKPAEIREIIAYAKEVGLNTVGDIDLSCCDRVARHLGCEYSFLNLLFQR